jgi:predicted phosphodiesterase
MEHFCMNYLFNTPVIKKSIFAKLLWLRWLSLFALIAISSCRSQSKFYQKILPPGNEYVEATAVQEDDSGNILVAYDQFPDSVRKKIDRLLPEGIVEDVNHWGPFRYTLMKKYPNGHSNQIYVYLNGRIEQVYYLNGDYMERPGLFFITGSEIPLAQTELPTKVRERIEQFDRSLEWVKSWSVESAIGPTYVVEMSGYQRQDTTAFAFDSNAVLKTMSTSRRMHRGVPRLWTKNEIQNLLVKNRERYGVDQVIDRIKGIPFDPAKGFRFAVFSDPQNNTEVLEAVCRSINDHKPVFAIITGDLVEDIEPDEYDKYLFNILGKYAHFNILAVIGNHDVGLDRMAIAHRAAFGDNALNYFFDYGNARFIIMDNVSRAIPFDEQLAVTDQWLSDTPTGFFKFVFVHVPPEEIKKWAYHSMSRDKSAKFTALMEKHQVDNVFTGHIHAYSTATYNGIEYTINGGSGGKIHKQYGPKGSAHHYLLVDVMADRVEQKLVQILPREQ